MIEISVIKILVIENNFWRFLKKGGLNIYCHHWIHSYILPFERNAQLLWASLLPSFCTWATMRAPLRFLYLLNFFNQQNWQKKLIWKKFWWSKIFVCVFCDQNFGDRKYFSAFFVISLLTKRDQSRSQIRDQLITKATSPI